MKPHNVPLNLLNVFLASATQQSFKAAADELCLTTSAVSQSIKKLEDLINITLFQRKANGVELTPSGKELLGYVASGMAEIDKGIQRLTQRGSHISIFCPPGIATQLLSPVLTHIITSGYEEIHMISSEQSCIDDYDKYDMAIILDESAKQIPNIIYLGPDYFFPFCHQHLYPKINHLADLTHTVLICNEYGKTSWQEWFKTNQLNDQASKTITFSRAAQLIAAINNSVGIGLESLRVISNDIRTGDYSLCNLPTLKPVVKDLTWLYVNPRKKHTKTLKQLTELIVNACTTDAQGYLKNQ